VLFSIIVPYQSGSGVFLRKKRKDTKHKWNGHCEYESFVVTSFPLTSGQGKAQAGRRGFIGLPLSHVPMAAGISFMSHTRGGESIKQALTLVK
jgi:hypothetical protein